MQRTSGVILTLVGILLLGKCIFLGSVLENSGAAAAGEDAARMGHAAQVILFIAGGVCFARGTMLLMARDERTGRSDGAHQAA